MTVLVVQHHVRDFDAWKPHFDRDQARRARHGATGHQLFRGADDPNDVLIVIAVPSAESASSFMTDPELRDVMAQAGVDSEPVVSIREEDETVSY